MNISAGMAIVVAIVGVVSTATLAGLGVWMRWVSLKTIDNTEKITKILSACRERQTACQDCIDTQRTAIDYVKMAARITHDNMIRVGMKLGLTGAEQLESLPEEGG